MRYKVYGRWDSNKIAFNLYSTEVFWLDPKTREERRYTLRSYSDPENTFYISPENKLEDGVYKITFDGKILAIPETHPWFNVDLVSRACQKIFKVNSEYLTQTQHELYKQLEKYPYDKFRP